MAKMTKEEFLNYYWKQYLFLENKVMNLEPYIYFCKKNLSVNSYEIMNLLFSVCSELDTFFKIVCNDSSQKIFQYRKSIESKSEYNNIFNESVDIIGRDINIKPFYKRKERKNFYWWTGYNNSKHNRLLCFKDANLNNLLNSLAALYILEVYYYKNNFGLTKDDTNMPEAQFNFFELTLLKPNFVNMGGAIGLIVDEW